MVATQERTTHTNGYVSPHYSDQYEQEEEVIAPKSVVNPPAQRLQAKADNAPVIPKVIRLSDIGVKIDDQELHNIPGVMDVYGVGVVAPVEGIANALRAIADRIEGGNPQVSVPEEKSSLGTGQQTKETTKARKPRNSPIDYEFSFDTQGKEFKARGDQEAIDKLLAMQSDRKIALKALQKPSDRTIEFLKTNIAPALVRGRRTDVDKIVANLVKHAGEMQSSKPGRKPKNQESEPEAA